MHPSRFFRLRFFRRLGVEAELAGKARTPWRWEPQAPRYKPRDPKPISRDDL